MKIYRGIVILTALSLLMTSCSDAAERNAAKTSEETTQPTDAYAGQIDTLLDQHEVWEITHTKHGDFDEYESQPFGWTVTDLDHDGYLEVIKAGIMGTGRFSWSEIYEVTEDGKLELRYSSFENENYLNADIVLYDSMKYFVNDGDYFYICGDTEGYMPEGYKDRYVKFGLVDDDISCENICWLWSNEETTYYDAADNEITEDEFNELVSKEVESGEFKEVNFLWTTEDVSRDALTAAATAFLGEKIS